MNAELIEVHDDFSTELNTSELKDIVSTLDVGIEAIADTIYLKTVLVEQLDNNTKQLANIAFEDICTRLGLELTEEIATEASSSDVDKFKHIKTVSGFVGNVIKKIILGIVKLIKFFSLKIRDFVKYIFSTNRKLEIDIKNFVKEVKKYKSDTRNPIRNTTDINLHSGAEILNLISGIKPKPPIVATESEKTVQKESDVLTIVQTVFEAHRSFTDKWSEWLNELTVEFARYQSLVTELSHVKILDHSPEDSEETLAPQREINRILGLDADTAVKNQTSTLTQAHNGLVDKLKHLPNRLNGNETTISNHGYFASDSYLTIRFSKPNEQGLSHTQLSFTTNRDIISEEIQLQPVLSLENIISFLDMALEVNKNSYTMGKVMEKLDVNYSKMESVLDKFSQLHNYNDSLKHVSKHLLTLISTCVKVSGPPTAEFAKLNIQLSKALFTYSKASFAQYRKEE